MNSSGNANISSGITTSATIIGGGVSTSSVPAAESIDNSESVAKIRTGMGSKFKLQLQQIEAKKRIEGKSEARPLPQSSTSGGGGTSNSTATRSNLEQLKSSETTIKSTPRVSCVPGTQDTNAHSAGHGISVQSTGYTDTAQVAPTPSGQEHDCINNEITSLQQNEVTYLILRMFLCMYNCICNLYHKKYF